MQRNAQEADIEAIAKLDGDLFPADCWNENTIRRELKLGISSVILEGNKVIAYIMMRVDGDIVDIIRIGVAKKHQRKGHGCALLTSAIETVAGRMMLTVRKDNAAAITLYSKLGFRPAGDAGQYIHMIREPG